MQIHPVSTEDHLDHIERGVEDHVVYKSDRCRLLQGDSIALLARMPARSFDLVFADPPYNLSNGGTTCQGGRRVSVNKGAWDASNGVQTDHAFHRSWLAACRRVLKPSGTLWVSGTQHVIFSLGFAMQDEGWHILNTVTWFKPNASPNLACRQFTHSTELLIWAAPRREKKLAHTFHYRAMKAENGGKQMRDVWRLDDAPDGQAQSDAIAGGLDGEGAHAVWTLAAPGKSEKLEGRHPTQKPRALLSRIVDASSSPGDLVLDPFNGSGTTGVVAASRGRRYVGIDRDRAYLDLTARRLAHV